MTLDQDMSNSTGEKVLNVTNLHQEQLLTVSRYLLLATLIVADIVSIFANLIVLLMTLCVEKLRKATPSMIVVNICILDLLASGTVVPNSIVVILESHWTWHHNLCIINGFLNTFFTCSIILTICVINVEKYYCIKFPMHHAVHMTHRKLLVAVMLTWVIAAIFASLPLIWDGYEFRHSAHQCTFLWIRGSPHAYFAAFNGLLFFLIPVIAMLFINYSVYKIAKRAMIQVEPIPFNIQCHTQPKRMRPCTLSVSIDGDTSGHFASFEAETVIMQCSARNSLPPSECSTESCDNDIHVGHGERTHIHNMSVQNPFSDTRRASRPPRANYKALKNLLVPFLYFLVIWGQYFLVHLCWIFNNYLPYTHVLETVCMVLMYVAYALNPFIFGILNKNFRDDALKSIKTLAFKFCCCKQPDGVIQLSNAPSCENFMQFLERKSHSVQDIRTNTIGDSSNL